MNSENSESTQPSVENSSVLRGASDFQALQVSEIRYRRLFEAARDGILIMDTTTSKITDSNPFMAELLGYSREDFNGKELADITVREYAPAAQEMMAQLHREGYVRYNDLPLGSKSRERRDVEIVGNIYSENGANVIQLNIRDNTESKRLKQAAEAEGRRAQALIESNISGIMLCDFAGRIVNANDTLLEMIGYTQEEVAGGRLRWNQLTPDLYAERDALAIEELKRTGRCKPFQKALMRKNGTIVPVLFGAALVELNQSEWVCWIADLSQVQAHQRAVEAANARLRRAMAETHHRVKNNLQIIAAMIDIQLMEATETVPTSVVKRLGSQVQTLATLHDMLTDEAKHSEEARSLDAFHVLNKLLPLIQETAKARLTFRGDHARFAVSQAGSLCLIANEIITNAIKHGRDTVDITFRANDQDAELIVEDDGPGFPAGFDAETMSNHGLEIVCQMARTDLSGSVVFETREGGGGRVTLKIPQYNQAILKEAQSTFASFEP